MKAIEILKNFVEEKLSTEELEMALYSNQELIEKLVSNEKEWFWLDSSFQSYGDAYEDE